MEPVQQILQRQPRFTSAVLHRGAFQVWWCRKNVSQAQRGSYFTVSEDGDDVVFWSGGSDGVMHAQHSGTAVLMVSRAIEGPGRPSCSARPARSTRV